MTRDELLSGAKPILFNTDMARAVRRAEDPKRATRRSIRWEKVREALEIPGRKANPDIPDEKYIRGLVDAPCDKGDILYVRETWNVTPEGGYRYRADGEGTGSGMLSDNSMASLHPHAEGSGANLPAGRVRAGAASAGNDTDGFYHGGRHPAAGGIQRSGKRVPAGEGNI